MEITKDEYDYLKSLDREHFSKKVVEYAKKSEYAPALYGCLKRKVEEEDNKYWVAWTVKLIHED